LHYKCKNCGSQDKLFALLVTPSEEVGTHGAVLKVGEFPQFGPPTPSRLIKLIGPDRELFLRGRRAEIHGLGIGAFAYYRRVVENQKGRILREITRVAETLGTSSENVERLKSAQTETQFTKAVEVVKDALPEVLLINGHNPLTLLHSALSGGLHDKREDECLDFARSVRIILGELSDRIGQALKDEAELKAAVSHLLQVSKKPSDPAN
jgi:hypothetical protein